MHKFEMKVDELCARGVLEGYFVNVLPINLLVLFWGEVTTGWIHGQVGLKPDGPTSGWFHSRVGLQPGRFTAGWIYNRVGSQLGRLKTGWVTSERVHRRMGLQSGWY